MAGAPFDIVEGLATRETSTAARELLVRQKEFSDRKADANRFIQSREQRLPIEAFRAWRTAVRSGQVPLALAEPPPLELAGYAGAAGELTRAELQLEETLERELSRARAA